MSKYFLFTTAALAWVLTSCDSDDTATLSPLPSPAVSVVAEVTSANSLSFSWTPVKEAHQYAYRLYSGNGQYLAGDLTFDTQVTFPILNPNATYQLTVNAFSRVGDEIYSASSTECRVTASTRDVAFTTAVNGPEVTLSWENFSAIDSIGYQITNVEDKQVVETGTLANDKVNEATFRIPELGQYVIAFTCLYGNGESADISGVSTPVTITELRKTEWKVPGQAYLDGLDLTIPVVLTSYEDGVYRLTSWYGGTEDLLFQIDSKGAIQVLNPVSSFQTYYYCATGRSEAEDDIDQVTIAGKNSYGIAADGTTKVTSLSQEGGGLHFSVELQNADGDEMDATGEGYEFMY